MPNALITVSVVFVGAVVALVIVVITQWYAARRRDERGARARALAVANGARR